MKKLLTLLSILLLLVGCGSPPSSSPPSRPKLTTAVSPNASGGILISWQSNDPAITSVLVETANSELLYTGAPNDSYTTNQPVRLVAYAGPAAVETLFINLPMPPPPPPTNGIIDFTISWSLPTTYTDGTPIDPADQANITVEAYYNTTGNLLSVDNTYLNTSAKGATSMSIVGFPVTYNFTYYFGIRCHIDPDGVWSEMSPPYPHSWLTP